MSLESAIPKELCSSCQDEPWGDPGWEGFFDESGSARMFRGDRSIRNIIEYDLEPQHLYEQSRDCKWCYILITETDLPKSFEGFQRSGYDKIRVLMKFCAPIQADKAKINSVHVQLDLSKAGRFAVLDMQRLAVWSKPSKNSHRILAFCAVKTHDI